MSWLTLKCTRLFSKHPSRFRQLIHTQFLSSLKPPLKVGVQSNKKKNHRAQYTWLKINQSIVPSAVKGWWKNRYSLSQYSLFHGHLEALLSAVYFQPSASISSSAVFHFRWSFYVSAASHRLLLHLVYCLSLIHRLQSTNNPEMEDTGPFGGSYVLDCVISTSAYEQDYSCVVQIQVYLFHPHVD